MHEIRQITTADVEQILSLNNSSVPAVTPLDESTLERLLALCTDRLVVGNPVEALCLTVGPGTQYWSANYDWVSNRFDSFIYLDRVCVAPPAQRRGIGKALYEQVEHANAAEWFVLEVNTRPLNQPSLDFHAALGFEEVGRAEPYGDGHEVAYLAKRIGQA